jgi:hypothetical protein
MKKLILLLLLCVTTFIFGQNENDKTDFPNENNSYVSFDLSTPINFVAPRYRFGYIHSLDENWRIGADLGFGSELTTWKLIVDNDNDNYLLLEARFELYHIINPTKRVNIYVSGETYVIHHQEVYYNGDFESENNFLTIRYDRADFKRVKYGLNLKFGVMIPFGDKLGMNAYIGAGPRIRDVTFRNIINPIEVIDDYDEDYGWWDSQYKTEGTELGFNFTLGLKFFYVFQ